MATLRKGKCYREVKRAYTRKSKFKKKGFIKAVPGMKIVRFDMGDVKKEFPCKVVLRSKEKVQLRHNAIESSRIIINRTLHGKL
jgi:large subunit ribosomal protein L10e